MTTWIPILGREMTIDMSNKPRHLTQQEICSIVERISIMIHKDDLVGIEKLSSNLRDIELAPNMIDKLISHIMTDYLIYIT